MVILHQVFCDHCSTIEGESELSRNRYRTTYNQQAAAYSIQQQHILYLYTKLTKETLEKFNTAPDIDDNTSLEQACDQFHEELHKMLERVAPQTKVKYADRPKNPCSGANLFTCYCSLIEDQIDNSITLTAFADDHSICNNFKAGNKEQEHKVKTDLEKTCTHLKQWMDMMHLKPSPNRTEYIHGSQQHLKKSSQEPLNAQGNPIAVSKVVRYQGGFLDQT